jgi:transcriptional regulator with XRE-family HTH domain
MKKSRTVGGNRLKALREFLGKTQLDVELEANLGTGYLQRVESGKVQHPERETIERILSALEARYTQRREILELFGYVMDAPLPDEEDIKWASTMCQAELDTAVFPAYLLDCANRLLVWNVMVPKLFPVIDTTNNSQTVIRLSMLHILFNPRYGVTPRITNPDVFFPASIRALRSEMQLFHSETWYEGLITELRSSCPVFERYWTLSEARPAYHIAARPLTPLEIIFPKIGTLVFRLLAEPFIQDRRFRVIYCLPANPITMQQCVEWSQSTGSLFGQSN